MLLILVFTILSLNFIFAAPVGPDGLVSNYNTTKAANSALMVNISGGVISSFNLTATIQNPRWKAFVGQVIGSFTLDDASGSTIYDWTLSTVTGRVYSTRASGAITWSSIACASVPQIETENAAINHDSVDDNITATFDDTTHSLFFVGATQINANTCRTLNTYRNGDESQGAGADFEEMVLTDSANIIYATILEEDVVGYDGSTYDFQMIVPEDGSPGFSGATPYYLYVEIGN